MYLSERRYIKSLKEIKDQVIKSDVWKSQLKGSEKKSFHDSYKALKLSYKSSIGFLIGANANDLNALVRGEIQDLCKYGGFRLTKGERKSLTERFMQTFIGRLITDNLEMCTVTRGTSQPIQEILGKLELTPADLEYLNGLSLGDSLKVLKVSSSGEISIIDESSRKK